MAWRYVRSTDGSDADNGSTWALADASIAGSAANDAAGDIIAVSQSHAGSYTSAQTVPLQGTLSNPVMVIGVNDSAEPPTAESTTASETITNNSNYTITGAVRWRKVNLTIGASGGTAVFNLGSSVGNAQQLYEEMTFQNNGSGTGSTITIGDSGTTLGADVTFKNVTYYPVNGAAGNKGLIIPLGRLVWEGGGLHASSVALTAFIATLGLNGRWGECVLSGLDLSPAASTVQIFPSSGTGYGVIANCLLPASWTGTLAGSAITASAYRVEMFDCIISGGARIRYRCQDNNGDIRDDTGIYVTTDTTDGVAAVSYKFSPNAGSTNKLGGRLVGPSMVIWNDTTGSSVTVSLDVTYDSATTLLDNELWLETCTLQTSGSGRGTWGTTENSNALATGTALSSASTAWTGTSGWSNQKKHTLTASFTPNQAGPVLVRLVYAKASGPAVYCDTTPSLS